MWDPPRPGLEPVSPAQAGRLSTTAPPGKPGIVPSYISYFLYGLTFLLFEIYLLEIILVGSIGNKLFHFLTFGKCLYVAHIPGRWLFLSAQN